MQPPGHASGCCRVLSERALTLSPAVSSSWTGPVLSGVLSLSVLLICPVLLGKSLSHSKPQFPHL